MSAFRIFIFLCVPSFVFAKHTLTLNWKAEPQFGGFYQAQEAGLFKNENLDIEIKEGGSGTPTVQMLANGTTDFAVVSAEEILISLDRNPKQKIVAIYAAFQTNPQIIMTHAERNFKSLQDVFMNEGTLAMQSGLTYAQFLLKKWPKPKVSIVPYPGGIGPFIQNKNYSQQGFLTSEPLVAEKAGLKTKSFLIADEGFNPYTTVVAVRKDFFEKNTQTVNAFVKAVREGWLQYAKDPSRANNRMSKINISMDLDSFKKSAEAQLPLIQNKAGKLGEMAPERWEKLNQQLKDLGTIKANLKVSEVYLNL